MTTTRWAATLDAFAACLAEQERLLAEDRVVELPVFTPAPELGPLPAALARRARELQARSAALTEEVALLTAEAGRRLTRARRLGSYRARRAGAFAVYVDQMT